MARTFTGSASVYAEYAGGVVANGPATLSAWIYPATVTANYCAVSVSHATDTTFFRLTTNTTGNVLATASLAGAVGTATTSTAMGAANVWYHICATYTSSTSRAAYLNGGGKGTNATSAAPAVLTRTSIGINHYSTNFFLPMNGRIAEVVIWNAALTDAEVAALASGVLVSDIRPTNLVGYWPLWGLHSPEIDLDSTPHLMTLNGSPAASSHSPTRPFTKFGNSAPLIQVAAAGGPFPWFTPIFSDRNFVNS